MKALDIQNLVNNLEKATGSQLEWYIKATRNNDILVFETPDCITPTRKIYMEEAIRINMPYQGNNDSLIIRLFMVYIKVFWPTFIIDDTNRPIIQSLSKIAAGISKKRGLILHGNVGTGKTTLLLIWIEFYQNILNPKLKVCFYTSQKLLSLFHEHSYSLFERVHGEMLILDDIGLNPEINHFGNKISIITEMILSRYNNFKFDPQLQFICTTNLNQEQLHSVIGERALSRLIEMTEWSNGKMTGSDRREQDGTLKEWPKNKFHNVFSSVVY